MTIQLIGNHFVDVYDPTIECKAWSPQPNYKREPYRSSETLPSIDSYRKQCMIDDEVVLLDINKIGQEEYPAMRELCMRNGDGFLLIYSVTSRQSFEEILILQQQILQVNDKGYFPILLVGNKCDLEKERIVSQEGTLTPPLRLGGREANIDSFNTIVEGKALAQQLGCKFIETSAKSRINVESAFYDLIREIRRYNKKHRPTRLAWVRSMPTRWRPR